MKANRWLCLLLAICLVFTLTACGGSGGHSSDDPFGGGGGGNGGEGEETFVPGSWLCFTSTGESTVSMAKIGSFDSLPNLKYSKNGEPWKDFVIGTTTVNLADGEKMYLRAKDTNNSFSKDEFIFVYFTMTGSIAASGNIMSLVDKTCTSTTIPCDWCFNKLFWKCISLKSAPELPATTLTENCYSGMFQSCSNLTVAPELPATTDQLETYCYNCMFDHCSSLNSITVHFTDWYMAAEVLQATNIWVNAVAATGNFYCPADLPDEVDDVNKSKKPSGWTRVPF